MVSQQDARGDGGALVFMIDTPEGSLLYQDTSGHWTGILHDLRPDVAILAAAGRGNVDGEPVQGSLAGFVARQASLARGPGHPVAPRRLAPGVLEGGRREEGAPKRWRWKRARTELAELDYLDSHEYSKRTITEVEVVTQQPSGGLEGYAALVTGGGTGIGKACAARLAADGAAVDHLRSHRIAARRRGEDHRGGRAATAGACSTSPPTSPTRTA